jgi:hypothetical protein
MPEPRSVCALDGAPGSKFDGRNEDRDRDIPQFGWEINPGSGSALQNLGRVGLYIRFGVLRSGRTRAGGGA